jgi:hypothetical protein
MDVISYVKNTYYFKYSTVTGHFRTGSGSLVIAKEAGAAYEKALTRQRRFLSISPGKSR